MVRVIGVESGSLADKAGILPEDILISVNGSDIVDVLDYRFYIASEKIVLSIHRGNDIFDTVIKKSEYEDIGLEFSSSLMDEQHCCKNKCIFCFIDQMPKGMRDTLYFKDDDSRMSFLTGSYITLTNLTEREVERIIEMRMSPINISVHTTNPELRVKMMKNPKAGSSLDIISRFAKAGIEMNCQLVICRGINDGKELERSMHDLESMHPQIRSVSVVPAGLTKHREGLYPLSVHTPEEAAEIIETVEAFADKCLEKHGSRIFFCGDELYIKAGIPLHNEEYYEGYPQLENGVGLVPSMNGEFWRELEYIDEYDLSRKRRISIATGEAAYGFISSIARALEEKCTDTKIEVYRIKNDFFGHTVTVAGLVTGGDILAQLKGRDLGEKLILPSVMLRYEKDLFLDGMSVAELEEKLGVKIEFCENDGAEFVEKIML